ncbi:hypothetical protein [Dyadobacter luticola]|nr:hypothetical protein [Dyadobacter luticola]
MKVADKETVKKRKVKVIGKEKSEPEVMLRAEFDGKLIALMKVKPPQKDL